MYRFAIFYHFLGLKSPIKKSPRYCKIGVGESHWDHVSKTGSWFKYFGYFSFTNSIFINGWSTSKVLYIFYNRKTQVFPTCLCKTDLSTSINSQKMSLWKFRSGLIICLMRSTLHCWITCRYNWLRTVVSATDLNKTTENIR